ncbi:MAG: DNA polymerase III subunit gamma/tau, partial [Lachnospiraceae bacterium]|nr:DNA polymerase III subunit gamma/tau [Lachnospiraceae bacterium]
MQGTLSKLSFSANQRTDAELCLLRMSDETLCGDVTALAARIERLENAMRRGIPAAPAAPAPKATPAPVKAAPAPVQEAKQD